MLLNTPLHKNYYQIVYKSITFIDYLFQDNRKYLVGAGWHVHSEESTYPSLLKFFLLYLLLYFVNIVKLTRGAKENQIQQFYFLVPSEYNFAF